MPLMLLTPAYNSLESTNKLSLFKFVKVSETAFSLTAGYFLAYWWSDKRITVKEGKKW